MTVAAPCDETRETSKRTLMSGNSLIPQLSRYSMASVFALATDVGLYTLLCGFAVNAVLAGITGYAAGMITHYILSSMFVFDGRLSQKPAARRLIEFTASGLLGLVLTGLVIGVMTEYFAASAIIAKLAAVILSFLAVFFVRRSIVFAPAVTAEIRA
jgi:putative flippase GtrA